MSNEIWVCVRGEVQRAELALVVNRPIGWATIKPCALPVEGRTVAAVVGRLGAERIPRRYPVAVDTANAQELRDLMNGIVLRGPYFDHAWLFLQATMMDRCGGEPDCFVGLLTRPQLLQMQVQWSLVQKRCLLDNGRVLDTVNQHFDSDGAEQTLELQGAEYQGFEPKSGQDELVLTTTPSTTYADLLRNAHSYYCIIHSSRQSHFRHGYITVRNLLLEQDYPDLHAVVSVRPIFSPRVKNDRVVLDSTTHAAIGLPQGEPVGLTPTRGHVPRLRIAVFGNRHCVARVGRTAMVDIEKPVTRVPDEIVDLLDVQPNERIVVEAVRARGEYGITRVSLRVLQWRERSPLLLARTSAGVPDFQELVGDEDFPTISLDLATRVLLGITPGTAVYLRPSVGSELLRQFASVSLALLATIVAAAILRSIELAVILALIYVMVTIAVMARRMRQ